MARADHVTSSARPISRPRGQSPRAALVLLLLPIAVAASSANASSDPARSDFEACERRYFGTRRFRATGPTDLRKLPFYDAFFEFGELARPGGKCDGRAVCAATQVPHAATQFMTRTRCFEKSWSTELVAHLEGLARARADFSPPDYPFAVPDHYAALDKHPIDGKRVLVAGSISPWLEAVALAYGAASVVTTDYQPIRIAPGAARLTFKHMDEMAWARERFDAVLSFSSVEHDGLGRYGDPLDPRGDFEALKEFARWLAPEGLLFLGIPVVLAGQPGTVESNCHRLYGARRRRAMFAEAGFRVLTSVEDHWGPNNTEIAPGKLWRNQPIFVLGKTPEAVRRRP